VAVNGISRCQMRATGMRLDTVLRTRNGGIPVHVVRGEVGSDAPGGPPPMNEDAPASSATSIETPLEESV
ncbi:MAG: hypothetical protein WKG32_10080, partial [Gemmatimonadaceae bacterium]